MRIFLVAAMVTGLLLLAGCRILLGPDDFRVGDGDDSDGGPGSMDGGLDPDAAPPQDPCPPRGPCAIASGNRHTCTMFGDGRFLCWGANDFGQLGIDGGGISRPMPAEVPGITGVTAFAAGSDHTCVVSTGGAVSCWGNNASGQIGTGSPTPDKVTSPASVNVPPVTQIAAGQTTCVRLMDGQAKCWGSNTDGQLGSGAAMGFSATPVDVMLPGTTTLQEIHSGLLHVCALDSDGNVLCWGDNMAGQIAGTADSNVPRSTGVSGVATLWAGERHNCVTLQNTGEVLCWGANADDQLGRDTGGAVSNAPEAVPGFTNATAAAAQNHNCAIVDKDLWCWGDNLHGQLGFDPATAMQTRTPTQVDLGGLEVIAVATGRQHTCAILADETIMCWGNDALGQLGDGQATNGDRFTPMPVMLPPT